MFIMKLKSYFFITLFTFYSIYSTAWTEPTDIMWANDKGICFYKKQVSLNLKWKSQGRSSYGGGAGTRQITNIISHCICNRGYNPKSACVFKCIENAQDIEYINNTIGCYYEASIDENVKPFDTCPALQCKCHTGNDRLCRVD